MSLNPTRSFPVLCMFLMLPAVAVAEQKGREYLTADGKLSAEFTFRDTQGGFAGFTGESYSVKPDGSWTVTRVFNQRKFEPHAKGKLSQKRLKELGELLRENKVLELPKQIGSKARANPLLITITFGRKQCICALPAGLKDPAKLPEGKLRDVGRRILAVRRFLRTNLKAEKKLR